MILAGLPGALAGMGLAMVLSHLVLIWVAREHGVWDGTHDLALSVLALTLGASALWLHWDRVSPLGAMG